MIYVNPEDQLLNMFYEAYKNQCVVKIDIVEHDV